MSGRPYYLINRRKLRNSPYSSSMASHTEGSHWIMPVKPISMFSLSLANFTSRCRCESLCLLASSNSPPVHKQVNKYSSLQLHSSGFMRQIWRHAFCFLHQASLHNIQKKDNAERVIHILNQSDAIGCLHHLTQWHGRVAPGFSYFANNIIPLNMEYPLIIKIGLFSSKWMRK